MPHQLDVLAGLQAAGERARPSDLRLGQQLAVDGGVEFSDQDDSFVAVVTGPPGTSRRTVRFSTSEPITWTCTCRKADSPWCKHVVAVVVAASQPS